jgi:hypothetical protein
VVAVLPFGNWGAYKFNIEPTTALNDGPNVAILTFQRAMGQCRRRDERNQEDRK